VRYIHVDDGPPFVWERGDSRILREAVRNADVVGDYVHVDDGPPFFWERRDYRILRCRGCEQKAYFQVEINFGREVDPDTGEETDRLSVIHWPVPAKRKRPVWFIDVWFCDGDLQSLLEEVYTALDNDLAVLAAIGIRTVFDRASELLGIDPELPFARKLDRLAASGKIGADEQLILAVLTDAGGAAAHRGWKPSVSELETMMDIIEAFIHRSFVLGKAASRLKKGVPARGKGGS